MLVDLERLIISATQRDPYALTPTLGKIDNLGIHVIDALFIARRSTEWNRPTVARRVQ